VLVTSLIVILAGIALPNYFHAMERVKGKGARSILKVMRAAEKSYSSESRIFTDLAINVDSDWASIGLENPNNNTNKVFSYSLTTTALGTGFTATATRIGGSNNGETITLTENGVWGGDWTI